MVQEHAGSDCTLDRTLTYCGEDGWELVTVLPIDSTNTNQCMMRLIFKRPAPEKRSEGT